MRFLPFFILAYIALGIQSGLAGYGTLYQSRPNLALLVVIFIAVNANRDAALLGCFLLGLTQDLLTGQSPLGLNAVSYGLIGMLVINTQEVVYSDHFLTHISLGLLGGLVYALLIYGHGWIYYSLIHSSLKSARPSAMPLVAGAFYTAALAPFVLAILRRIKRVFGFRPLRSHGNGRR